MDLLFFLLPYRGGNPDRRVEAGSSQRERSFSGGDKKVSDQRISGESDLSSERLERIESF